jgi:ATP-dependent Zn protease
MFNDQNNKQPGPPPRSPLQGGRPSGLTLFFFLVMAAVFIAYFFRGNSSPVREIRYSHFSAYLEQNKIDSVTISDTNVLDIILKGQSPQEPVHLRTRIP